MLNRRRTSDLRAVALEGRSVVLYTGGCLSNPSLSRSATSLLRHLGPRVLAVIDDRSAGSSIEAIVGLSSFGTAPVLRDPLELGDENVDVIIAMDLPPSKRLMNRHRSEILDMAEAGHRVWNGLRESLAHPNVHDLRSGAGFGAESGVHRHRFGSPLQSTRVVCLGTDAAVSPLETTIALQGALSVGGHTADWLPTSPAGVLLRGYGSCVEGAPSHRAPGIIEELVMGLEASAAVVVVEGVGSLLEPADGSLVAAVAAGARSDYHVLCHHAEPDTDVAARLLEAVDRCEATHRAVGVRSRLLAVVLDPGALSGADVHRSVSEARSLGVPCVVMAADRGDPHPVDASPIVLAFDSLHARVSG